MIEHKPGCPGIGTEDVTKCTCGGDVKYTPDAVDSTSDKRIVNNVMRHEYRVLSDTEKSEMKTVKDMGVDFVDYINMIPMDPRSRALAITNMQQAVMWATHGITGPVENKT